MARDTKPEPIVLLSTPSSIEDRSVSVAAIVETLFAVWLYWELASILNTQSFLWFGVLAIPLLLLRSDVAVDKAEKSISDYVDRSFIGVLVQPQKAFRSQFMLAIGLAIASGGLAAFLCSRLAWAWLSYWNPIAIGIAVGYAALQVALGAAIASAAREVAIVAERRSHAIGIAVALTIPIIVGSALGGNGPLFAASSGVIAGAASMFVLLSAPRVFMWAVRERTAGGMAIADAIGTEAPTSFVAFMPGLLLGVFFRSVLTRLYWTFRYFLVGCRSLPPTGGEQCWRPTSGRCQRSCRDMTVPIGSTSATSCPVRSVEGMEYSHNLDTALVWFSWFFPGTCTD